MGEYNDVICVTRYCPHCGTEIFCRTDAGSHKVFYLSEDMVNRMEEGRGELPLVSWGPELKWLREY